MTNAIKITIDASLSLYLVVRLDSAYKYWAKRYCVSACLSNCVRFYRSTKIDSRIKDVGLKKKIIKSSLSLSREGIFK